jgi:hypothetical protein
MERLLRDGDDRHAVLEVWAAAMNASGRDNISVVLVRWVPPRPASNS